MSEPKRGRSALEQSTERAAAYNARATALERTLALEESRHGRYVLGFVLLAAGGVGCFAFGWYAGFFGTFSATLVSVGGYAMTRVRLWELRTEAAELRRESRKLREGG